MADVFSSPLDEHQSAFVDPWSHQPQNWGDIPDDAVFAGAWHLNVGIDTLHEALFLARDDHGDRLWSLTTPAEKATRENLDARDNGDRAWIKRKISCGCVAGAVRVGSPRDAASILMKETSPLSPSFFRLGAALHARPAHKPRDGGIVGAFEQELRRNTVAAEADQQRDEAAIIIPPDQGRPRRQTSRLCSRSSMPATARLGSSIPALLVFDTTSPRCRPERTNGGCPSRPG